MSKNYYNSLLRITTLFLIITGTSFGQNEILTLDSCLQLAKNNYPLIKQNNLINEKLKYDLKIDKNEYLPRLTFNSKASYQSEVISFQGLTFPRDNYITGISLEQSLYDGGVIKQKLKLDKLTGDIQILENKVELYKIIDRVNQLYSNILLTRENIKILNIYADDIKNKTKTLTSSVKNGLALQSSLDELEAENLKTEQSIVEASENLLALYLNLGMFINRKINDNTILSIESTLPISEADEIRRPELQVFDNQKLLLEETRVFNAKNDYPKLSVGAEGNYGRPGPNFLNQNQRFFGSANINLKWNISSLYNNTNEDQKLSINKQKLDIQKEEFEFNLRNTLTTELAQIKSLRTNIQKDKLIVNKRHSITSTASNQVENGSITTTEYLIQLNAEMQAVLNEKLHEIKLMNAISNYNTTKGISNF